MRRFRRHALGLVAAGAAHLLAALVLLPEVRLGAQERSEPSNTSAPLIIVELVRLRPEAKAAAVPAQPQPQSAPRSKSVSLPETPAPFDVALSDPPPPSPSAPTRPEDDDALYRVPFRSAVGQADARLRAGLDCAHVDLPQLPKTEFDLCAATVRFRDETRGPKGGPLG